MTTRTKLALAAATVGYAVGAYPRLLALGRVPQGAQWAVVLGLGCVGVLAMWWNGADERRGDG